jgi:hypothetical protein
MRWDDLTGEEYAALPLNVHSNALAASLEVKTGTGRLYGFSVLSTSASDQYVQVHDAQTLPGDGAVPVAVFLVSAGTDKELLWIPGRTFLYGCFLCNSSTVATKTIGSADCFFDVQYI